METVKMDRFAKIPDYDNGLSIVDLDAWDKPNFRGYSHIRQLITVSTGNKELDKKIIDLIFNLLNTDEEYLELLNNPDKS